MIESKALAFFESDLVRDVAILNDFATRIGTSDLGSDVLRYSSGVGHGIQEYPHGDVPNSDKSVDTSDLHVGDTDMEKIRTRAQDAAIGAGRKA